MPIRFAMGTISFLLATALVQNPSVSAPADSTRANLLTAMKGEAFAYLKYSLYAEQAERSGHQALAATFRKAADVERHEHFAELAELYKLVGDDVANLNDAIAGENYETTQMYPGFSRQALAAGDKEAAARFAEIAKDEAKHRDMFKAALKDRETPKP